MGVAGDSVLEKRDKRVAAQHGNNGNGAEWRGYINVQLTADLKAQYAAWSPTEDVWEALREAVEDGCQLSLKYVGGEKTFLASLTQRTPGHVNAGLCVTARGAASDTALFRVLFLYRVLGGADSWEKKQPVADPDRW